MKRPLILSNSPMLSNIFLSKNFCRELTRISANGLEIRGNSWKFAAKIIEYSFGLILFLFTLRRWLFLWASHGPNLHAKTTAATPPSVLLLVPLRNEATTLPSLFRCLEKLEYPSHRLTVVLIDDASRDGSLVMCQSWAKRFSNWHLLTIEQNGGKAAALNLALARFPMGEIVVVYDADERPFPPTLSRLVQPFNDAQVAIVNGRRQVSNPLASWIASYATFENLLHQHITVQGKDRLNLAPPALGSNCAYRRAALAAMGNFKPGALLEDSDLTVRLARAGWQTRFMADAVSTHAVPHTPLGYWQQRTRWAGGFQTVAQEQAPGTLREAQLPWPLRLELFAFSLGYLDRLVFLLSGIWLGWQRRPSPALATLWLTALLTPFIQTLAALKYSPAAHKLRRRLLLLPLLFPLDIAATLAGITQTWRKQPIPWHTRQPQPIHN